MTPAEQPRPHVLELTIPPPIVALLTLAAMWGLAKIGTPAHGPAALRHVVAPALGLAGMCLAFAGVFTFRRAHTTVNPHTPAAASALVTGGVYRLTRNPMYLGLLLLLLAGELILWSPWSLLGPAAFVLYITRFQIVPEERRLAERFGAAYAAYTSTVRRWL